MHLVWRGEFPVFSQGPISFSFLLSFSRRWSLKTLVAANWAAAALGLGLFIFTILQSSYTHGWHGRYGILPLFTFPLFPWFSLASGMEEGETGMETGAYDFSPFLMTGNVVDVQHAGVDSIRLWTCHIGSWSNWEYYHNGPTGFTASAFYLTCSCNAVVFLAFSISDCDTTPSLQLTTLTPH